VIVGPSWERKNLHRRPGDRTRAAEQEVFVDTLPPGSADIKAWRRKIGYVHDVS
jgi:hypothetical protein